MSAQLRLFDSDDEYVETDLRAPTVCVQLGDLLPLVALAQRHNYLWLRDFLQDEVQITEDLYEILQAFRSYRPSA